MDDDAMQWSLEQENAEVLAELAKDGIDLEGARDIEFLLAFPDEAAAQAAHRALTAGGFDAAVHAPEAESAADGRGTDDGDGDGDGDDAADDGDGDGGFGNGELADETLDDDWIVTVTRVLEPTAPAITEVEEQLAAIAAEHGGESDGWTFTRGD